MSQKIKIKCLFESKPNQWISLLEIFPIAKQYNTRIKELRSSGMCIKNKTMFVNKQKHSWFMYIQENN